MFRVEPRNVVRRCRDIALSLFDDGAASSGENATDVPVVLMAAQEGNLFSKFLETKPIPCSPLTVHLPCDILARASNRSKRVSFEIIKTKVVEPSGIEPLTSCMPCRRSPS